MKHPSLHSFRSKWLAFAATAVVLSILAYGIFRAVLFQQQVERKTGLSAGTVAKLIFDSGAPVKTSEGRVNILLLGIGGGTHDGPDLTDSIVVVSVRTEEPDVAMISVPRDVWSDTLRDKVNSAYHYGEEKKKGGGLILAKAIMEDVTGMTMHYAAVIDFSQFKALIDSMGGIDVNVQKAFTDPEYPIAGKENDPCNGDKTYACRYEVLRFGTGMQHMDGERALKYVRSRHAQGEEGTDFARSRRQQEVMTAMKDKIMSQKPWMSPALTSKYIDGFDRATDMDMTLGEALTVAKAVVQAGTGNIRKISLESQFTVPPEGEYDRYVLVPEKSYDAVHRFVAAQLGQTAK